MRSRPCGRTLAPADRAGPRVLHLKRFRAPEGDFDLVSRSRRISKSSKMHDPVEGTYENPRRNYQKKARATQGALTTLHKPSLRLSIEDAAACRAADKDDCAPKRRLIGQSGILWKNNLHTLASLLREASDALPIRSIISPSFNTACSGTRTATHD